MRQKTENVRKTKRQVRSIHYKSNNYCYISITCLAPPISKFGVTNKQPYIIRTTVILKSNYKIIYFLLLFLLLLFFFYNPYPSLTSNSRLQLHKNPSSVCQPCMYLLKSKRRKWNRDICTKMTQKSTVSPTIIFKYLQCAKKKQDTLNRSDQLSFISYNTKSCLDLFTFNS